jgi:hypothetical protein
MSFVLGAKFEDKVMHLLFYTVPKIGKKYSQKGNWAALSPNFYIHVHICERFI